MNLSAKKVVRISARILLWTSASVLVLLLLLYLLFRIPAVQTFTAQKTVGLLSEQLETEVSISRLSYEPPGQISIYDFYIEGNDHDSLLHFRKLSVSVNLLNLLKKKVDIKYVDLKQAKILLVKYQADQFNFSFSEKDSEEQVEGKRKTDWTFNLEKLLLNNINFQYTDKQTNNSYNIKLGELYLHMNDMDIQKQKFELKRLQLKDSDVNLIINSSSGSGTSTTGLPNFNVDENINIIGLDFSMNNKQDSTAVNIENLNFEIFPQNIDLISKQLALGDIRLWNTNIALEDNTKNADADTTKSSQIEMPWNVSVNSFKMKNNAFAYNYDAQTAVKGFDAGHINMKRISAGITAIRFNKDTIMANFDSLTLSEGRQFVIRQFEGSFSMKKHKLSAEDVIIRTQNSIVSFSVNSSNFNIQKVQQTMDELYFELNIERSQISDKDIVYFYPAWEKTNTYGIRTVIMSANMQGNPSDLNVNSFYLNTDDIGRLSFYGQIKGLPSVKKSYADILIDSLYVNGNELQKHIPDTALPQNIALPDYVNFSGNIRGGYQSAKADLSMISSAGNMGLNAQYSNDLSADSQSFQTSINTDGLDVSKIISKGDTFGLMSFSLIAEGKLNDFKIDQIETDFEGKDITLLGYPYSNIEFQGSYANDSVNALFEVKDSNIILSWKGYADLKDSVPALKAELDMKGADLEMLNLAEDQLRLAFHVSTEFKGDNPDNANGFLKLKNLNIVGRDTIHKLDSLIVDIKNQSDKVEIDVNSDFLHASYNGSVKTSDLPSVLINHVNEFVMNKSMDTLNPIIPEQFSLKLNIIDHSLISSLLLEKLSNFNGLMLKAEYNESSNTMSVKALISPFDYSGLELDSTILNVNTSDSGLYVNLTNHGLFSDPLTIYDAKINAVANSGKTNLSLKTHDKEGNESYFVNAHVNNRNDQLVLSIDTQDLLLNRQDWNINPGNQLIFADDSFLVHNMSINRNRNKLKIDQNNKGDIAFLFKDFHLATLANIALKDDFINTILSGKATVSLGDKLSFGADISMDSVIAYNGLIFDSASVDADVNSEGNVSINSSFKRSNGVIALQGEYLPAKDDPIDFMLDISHFNMKHFKGFTSEILDTIDGHLDSKLKITGSFNKPDLEGSLSLSELYITPTTLSQSFRVDDEDIELKNGGMNLNNFEVEDEQGNTLKLSGKVNNLFEEQRSLDMKVSASNFTWINSTREGNDLFYGKQTVDIDAGIDGNLSSPVIDATINIKENSDFFLILPQNQAAAIEQEGLVVFIKEKTAKDTNDILFEGYEQKKNQDFSYTEGSNMSITARINTDKKAKHTVVINPATDERFVVQGESNLNFSRSASGQQSLTGRFNIYGGTYHLILYEVLHKEFNIERGSSIIFSGDPLEARTDISAVYKVKTAPKGLLASAEMSGNDANSSSKLSRQIPFLVRLNIDGQVMKPELDFDIALPKDVQATQVANKLAQLNQNESEVNKQAFALLMFGSFIQSSMSTSHPVSYQLNNTARSSVSNILSSQLNQLADNYVEGFDINVNVNSYSDYVNQQREDNTNVEVDVQKQLFNERLTVQVGGQFNVEGNEEQNKQKQQDKLSSLTGDVRVFYELTPDGRWILKGFNTTEYGDLLEGEVRKTGLGIIYNRDFYMLSELWKKQQSNQNDKVEKQNKENE